MKIVCDKLQNYIVYIDFVFTMKECIEPLIKYGESVINAYPLP